MTYWVGGTGELDLGLTIVNMILHIILLSGREMTGHHIVHCVVITALMASVQGGGADNQTRTEKLFK